MLLCLLVVAAAPRPALGQAVPAVLGMGDLPHGVADLNAAIRFYEDVVGLELLATVPTRVNGTVGPNVYDARLQALMDVGGAYYRIATFRIPGTDARLRLYELINNQGIFRLRGSRQATAATTERGSHMLRLHLRDLDTIAQRISADALSDLLTGGERGHARGRVLTVRDEDGFLLQLLEHATDTAIGARASPVAIVLTAADGEAKLRFYRDLLGFTLATGEWERVPAGLPGAGAEARVRRTVGVVPGSGVPIEIHEYDGIRQKRFFPTSVGQAGVGWIQLLVRDLDDLMRRFVRARVRIVSTGLQPVMFDDSRRVVVRDPDGVFIELIEPHRTADP